MIKNIDKVVKTQKIQILKPISTDWKTFNKVVGDMTYNTIKIMNEAITIHYLHLKEKHKYKELTGKSMSVKEVYGVSRYKTIIDRELKEKFTSFQIAGDTIEQSIGLAIDTFNTQGKDVLSSNASLPTFRRDQPIPVRGRALRLNEKYQAYLPFITKEKAKELGFTGANKQSFLVQLDARKNAKIVMDKILSGENTICDSKIQKTKDGKWFLLLAYKQPIKQVKLNKDTIVGIDLGINKAAYMAVNNSKQNFFIDGGELRAYRNKIRGRRKSLQNQLRVCSVNRRGHGRKTLLKPLEALREKEANFNDTVNHRYAKAIVDWVVKQRSGKIQMEDLSNIKNHRKDNKMLGKWTYYDLAEKIEYKAKEKGIKVIKINPQYTSQRCNHCGIIDKENRNIVKNGQELFECVTCGNKTNADLNAARNIAMNNIENIIEEQLEVQKNQQGRKDKIEV